jgi:hypothetical protein
MHSWIAFADLNWKYLRVLHSVLVKCQMLNLVWCRFAPNLSPLKVKGMIVFTTQLPRMRLRNGSEITNMSISGTYIDARRSARISLKAPSARSRDVSVDMIDEQLISCIKRSEER